MRRIHAPSCVPIACPKGQGLLVLLWCSHKKSPHEECCPKVCRMSYKAC
jgi:hypothetical protein